MQHSTANITIYQNLKNNYNINCKTNIVPIFKKYGNISEIFHELHVFITTKFVPRGRSKLGIKF